MPCNTAEREDYMSGYHDVEWENTPDARICTYSWE